MFADSTYYFALKEFSNCSQAIVSDELHKVSKWFCSKKL